MKILRVSKASETIFDNEMPPKCAPLALDTATHQFLKDNDSVLPNETVLYHFVELCGQHGLYVVDPIGYDDAITVRSLTWIVVDSLNNKELNNVLRVEYVNILGIDALEEPATAG